MNIEASNAAAWQRSASSGTAVAARLLPIGLALLATLAFLPSLRGLLPLWQGGIQSNYSQGPLLALVSLFLIWRAGAEVERTPTQPSRAALAGLALISLAWATAWVAGVSSVAQALWPFAAWLLIGAVLGLPAARRFTVALALLYFAIPVWGPLVEHVLLPLSANVPPLLLKLIGTPVYSEGAFIHVPEGVFEVEFGCSGLNFFLAACSVAVLLAHLERASPRQWVTLVSIAVALAMIANWVRIAMVVYAGHVTNMQHPWVTVDHKPLGWTIFAVTIFGYCLGVRRWLAPRSATQLDADSGRSVEALHNGRPAVAGAILALLALSSGPAWVVAATRLVSDEARLPLRLPDSVAGLGPKHTAEGLVWRPRFVGAVQEVTAVYGEGTAAVFAYVNAYGRERPDGKLIYYWNSVMGEHWRERGSSEFVVRRGSDSLSGAELAVVDEAGNPWLVRYTYGVGERFTPSPIRVKILTAAAAMTLRSPRKGVIATAARCAVSCDMARSASDALWQTLAARASDKDASKP